MKKIVILISGRGSNMEAIVQACSNQGWAARVAAVISNEADAPGLAYATKLGIATGVVAHQDYGTREAFDDELARTIDGFGPDVVALAGFMRVLTPGFVRHYAGRLVNVHPSLLPAFPGLHTHRRALEAGTKITGATVHLVTDQLDHGPILIQAAVPVQPGDTEETLSRRVLDKEHQIYPQAVRWMIEGTLRIQGNQVVQTEGEPQLLVEARVAV
ncbi:MAG: phosphoribosylglycinamide formyltransferase [Myxococcales bacterium]